MSTPPPQVLQLARQGHPDAIATLMNQHLESKGITARVAQQGDRLEVVLEAAQVPPQSELVAYVTTGITGLELATIHHLSISGKQLGTPTNAWTEAVQLKASTASIDATATPISVVADDLEFDLGLESEPNNLDFDINALDDDFNLAAAESASDFDFDLNPPANPLESELGLDPDIAAFDLAAEDFDLETEAAAAPDLDLESADAFNLATPDSDLDFDLNLASVESELPALGNEATFDLEAMGDLGLDLGLGDRTEPSPTEVNLEAPESPLDFGLDLGFEESLAGFSAPVDPTDTLDFDLGAAPDLDFEAAQPTTEDLNLEASLEAFNLDSEPAQPDDGLDFDFDLSPFDDSATAPEGILEAMAEAESTNLEAELEVDSPPMDDSATSFAELVAMEAEMASGTDFDPSSLATPEPTFDSGLSLDLDEASLFVPEEAEGQGGLDSADFDLDLEEAIESTGGPVDGPMDEALLALETPEEGFEPDFGLESLMAESSPNAEVESAAFALEPDLWGDGQGADTAPFSLVAEEPAIEPPGVEAGVDDLAWEVDNSTADLSEFSEIEAVEPDLGPEPLDMGALEEESDAVAGLDSVAFDPHLVFAPEGEFGGGQESSALAAEPDFDPGFVLDPSLAPGEAEPPAPWAMELDASDRPGEPEPAVADWTDATGWDDEAPILDLGLADEGGLSPADWPESPGSEPSLEELDAAAMDFTSDLGEGLLEDPLEGEGDTFDAEPQPFASEGTMGTDVFEEIDTLDVNTDFGYHPSPESRELESLEWTPDQGANQEPWPEIEAEGREEFEAGDAVDDDFTADVFDPLALDDRPFDVDLPSQDRDATNGFLNGPHEADLEANEPDATDEFIHKFAPVSPEEVAQRTPGRANASGSRTGLLLALGAGAIALALAALGLNALLGRMRQPTTPGVAPPVEAPIPAEPGIGTTPPTAADPFRDAVNSAMEAATLAQTAKTKAEWQAVADAWTRAIDLMKQVPADSPNYGVAQQKAIEYQPNLAYAQQNVQRLP